MTPINNIDDLVRILDEHPEWVEALRARLLSRELLELPEKFAELSQSVAEQAQTIAELSQKVAELSQTVAELVATVSELVNEQRATNRRLDRLQDDVGWLKGRIIYDIVRNDAGLIAWEMGFDLERTLVRADLIELTRSQDDSDLPRGDMLSFHRADLVMQVADEEGRQQYVAVEASFTVNGRDSRRALRNAELLTRFTGQPAMAAVAGVRYDWELKELVESERLHWYEIPSEDLEAE